MGCYESPFRRGLGLSLMAFCKSSQISIKDSSASPIKERESVADPNLTKSADQLEHQAELFVAHQREQIIKIGCNGEILGGSRSLSFVPEINFYRFHRIFQFSSDPSELQDDFSCLSKSDACLVITNYHKLSKSRST